LSFPLLTHIYIHGETGEGAYVGSSTIGQLTGKNDFAGYVYMAPFSDLFWQFSKEKDYESIKRVLGLLNIRYIFHNSDTRIYDQTFPGRPYSTNYVRKFMPSTQKAYEEFIDNLASEKLFERGFYRVYTIADDWYLPHFYIPREVSVYEDDPGVSPYGKASAFFDKTMIRPPVYIEHKACVLLFSSEICDQKRIVTEEGNPTIQFKKVNPAKYRINVSGAHGQYILAFSEAFHKNWKIYVSSTRALSEGAHIPVNGYANAWRISPEDVGGRSEYELIVEMTGQGLFYVSLGISLMTLAGFFLWMWHNNRTQ